MAFIEELKAAFSNKPSKFKTLREQPAAFLPDSYESKMDDLLPHIQKDVLRYLHIFNNDITPVLKYIDEMSTEGKSDIENFTKLMSDKDKMKWGDYKWRGKKPYDMMYRRHTKSAKDSTQAMLRHPLMQLPVGVSTGVYNTLAGTAELAASLSDLSLDTDTLSKVEKALPAIDLMDIYGDSAGSVAKFTSILVQYGLGWGIARKIAQKVIGKLARKKLAMKAGDKLAKISIPSLTGTRTGMDIARFGGYWILPAALGDAVVSTQANITLGDAFGDDSPEASRLRKILANSKTESLEGLTGKERAAAILRNKLKFAEEGAALFGGITLVGPSLKLAAKTLGKGLAGHTVRAADPASKNWGKLRGAAGLGEGKELFHIPGAGDIIYKGGSKLLAAQTPAKWGKFGNLGPGRGLKAAFDIAKKGWSKGMTRLGIPKYEFWKFSDTFTFKHLIDDWIIAPLRPSWKFDKGSATALRQQQNMVRKVKKDFDAWTRLLDRNMYGLVKAGAMDIAFQTRTATKALSYWNDVIKYMRGEVKIDALPKSLRTGSRAIRKMIDDQTKQLQPIIRDMDVRDELVKNMGKYLHTSYEIFKSSKWRADSETYKRGVDYFVNLLKQANPQYKNAKKGSDLYKDLLNKAKLHVSEIMKIGRREGTTPGMRLKEIMNKSAEIKVPANIFKDIKNIPDEIASLLGKVRDPKNIILDTLVEQAHTIHSYNAYRNLANSAMGKWIFKNEADYLKTLRQAGVKNPRGLDPITVKKPYNMDLEDIFKNADGTPMLAVPEMAKAIGDQTLLIDTALKFPFWKAALAIKAGTQINKTVLSLMTQMRNVSTASMFAMANGHVGKGASVADNFEMLWAEMVGRTKDQKKLRELLSEALEAGALDSSTIATELEKLIPELMGASKVPIVQGGKITGKTVSDWADTGLISDEIFSRLLTNKGAIGRLVQKSIEAYQLGDNVWKLFGYQFTKSQLKPAFKNMDDVKTYFREVEGFDFNPFKAGSTTAGRNGQNLKTVDDAIKEVAGLIVRDTYPNYSMVPRAVQTIRKIPFFGNFVGFTSEMWRNSYEMLRRGTAEMASTNPYIRQMGARRLLGFITTIGTVTPIAYNTAQYMTGVTSEMIDAYKQSFGAEFQEGHTLIPITKQDPVTKKFKAIDADSLHPYSDVQMPFKMFMETWRDGKKTDQSTLGLFRTSMIKSVEKTLEPFLSPSIMWETFGGGPGFKKGEIWPDKNGIAKSKSGALIADWKNDQDPWSKTLYYIYSKVLPTTLKSFEKIFRAFNGQVSKSGIEYDPMTEVAATLAGFRMLDIDGFKGMKYRVGQIGGELANARKVWINRAINPQSLMDDFERIENGLSPIGINSEFNNYQKNRYRIWSDAYRDIENLRKLNYTESQIRDMIEGRRTFSAQEVNSLLLGRYKAAKPPEINFLKENGFSAQIKEINRGKGTQYLPQEFYNKRDLINLQFKWNNAPLGVNLSEIEDELGVPIEIRSDWLEDDQDIYENLIDKQELEDEQRIENEQRLREERMDKLEGKQTVPIGTPPLDTEIFTASRVYPTNSGTIDQNTGLTRNQTALLSPGEQEIAKRSNQGIGSLT